MAACFIIAGIAAVIVWQAMVGGKLLDMQKGLTNPANADAVKMVQLISSGFMFLLPSLIFARIVNRQPLKHLGLTTRANWTQAGFVALMIFTGFFLSGALGELSYHIPLPEKTATMFKNWEKEYTDQVMAIANMQSLTDYLYSLVVIALAPAIFEELVFRGVLQQLFVRWTRSAWIGIIITSIIFSAIHFSFYGFLSRFALGMVLGFIFYYSNSLWLNILAHFLNNGFAVTAMYFMSRQGKLTPDAMEDRFPVWYALAAGAVMILLLQLFAKESKRIGTYFVDNTDTTEDDPFADEPSTIL